MLPLLYLAIMTSTTSPPTTSPTQDSVSMMMLQMWQNHMQLALATWNKPYRPQKTKHRYKASRCTVPNDCHGKTTLYCSSIDFITQQHSHWINVRRLYCISRDIEPTRLRSSRIFRFCIQSLSKLRNRLLDTRLVSHNPLYQMHKVFLLHELHINKSALAVCTKDLYNNLQPRPHSSTLFDSIIPLLKQGP